MSHYNFTVFEMFIIFLILISESNHFLLVSLSDFFLSPTPLSFLPPPPFVCLSHSLFISILTSLSSSLASCISLRLLLFCSDCFLCHYNKLYILVSSSCLHLQRQQPRANGFLNENRRTKGV